MLALAAIGGVAVYPVLATDRVAVVALIASVGGLSLLLFSAAPALRSPGLVAWAVALCGAEYAVFLGFQGRTVDRWAPLVAAALFLAAELGYRATESSVRASEREVVARGILWAVAGVLGTVALGAVILAVAGGATAGLALEAVGVVAAVAALALVVGAASRAAR